MPGPLTPAERLHGELALAIHDGTGDCCEVLEIVRKYLPDPEEHATTSRDYGRGFADALKRVRQTLGET